MILLCCGPRDWRDQARTDAALDATHAKRPITLLVEGGQISIDKKTGEKYGGDWTCRVWAEKRGVPCATEPADWDKHGKAAGPIRNGVTLEKYKPDGVMALPCRPGARNGGGTGDMVRRAVAGGVKVWRPYGV